MSTESKFCNNHKKKIQETISNIKSWIQNAKTNRSPKQTLIKHVNENQKSPTLRMKIKTSVKDHIEWTEIIFVHIQIY